MRTKRIFSKAIARVVVMVLGLTGVSATAAHGAGPAGETTRIAWSPCPQNASRQCGTVRVPVDWARPHGAKIDIAVARRLATDPGSRIGSLMFDLGGPSGSGVDAVIFAGDQLFNEEILRRFDIVGMDARGVGRSQPVLCSGPLLRAQPDPEAASQEDLDRIVAYNEKRRADCRARTGPVFDHVDTLSVVRDLDVIRAALGEAKLTFYGLSYGTVIGTQYAERFPHRVRAIVLDSILDHSLDTKGLLDAGAVTVQDSFDEFVAWCNAVTGCALHGRDVRAVWADLLARIGRGEIPFPPDPSRPLLRSEFLGVMSGAFYGPFWGELADLLLALYTGPVPADPLPEPPPVVADPSAAIRCADWYLPLRDHAEFAAHLRRIERLAPDMRYSAQRVFFVADCLGTPRPIPNPQHRLQVRNSPPLLMVNSLHDPATSYNMATNVAAQLGNRHVLLTYEGWGHGVYGRGACADSAIDRYLISLTLPAAGAWCPAVPPEMAAATGSPRVDLARLFTDPPMDKRSSMYIEFGS